MIWRVRYPQLNYSIKILLLIFAKMNIVKRLIFFSFFSLIFFISVADGQVKKNNIYKNESIAIKINWSKKINGDFSFKNKWSYTEGISKNDYGQLTCDGFCPPEIYEMMDSIGRIKEDSIKSFYKIVDTSHQIHSISCDAWCYEYAGTSFIEVVQQSSNNIFCSTLNNAATHSSLKLHIVDGKCFAIIELTSISKAGSGKFYCNKGSIYIDKSLLGKGIMKATFNFYFENKKAPKKQFYWKCKIYSKIKRNDINK
jgi:hypothetical protein